MSLFKTKRKNEQPLRSGIAVVEVAVCLPILVVIVLGSIEACNSIFLKQTATGAAYEAAKICTSVGGTELAAQTRVSEVLSSRNLTGGTVVFSPPLTDYPVRGTHISVTVSIPTTNNLGGIEMFYLGRSITASVTMVKQ